MGGVEIPMAVSGCELKSRQEWGRAANKGNLGNAIFRRDSGLEISGKGVCVGVTKNQDGVRGGLDAEFRGRASEFG